MNQYGEQGPVQIWNTRAFFEAAYNLIQTRNLAAPPQKATDPGATMPLAAVRTGRNPPNRLGSRIE